MFNFIIKTILSAALITSSFLTFAAEPIGATINYKPSNGGFCHDFGKYGYNGDSDYYLCRQGYVVAYNCKTKQANYVISLLTGSSVSYHRKRKDKFMPDKSLPKRCRSELSDYRKSGYDRGHLAPYASMDFSRISAKQSFLLSNMSPQKAGLNRKGWAKLEGYVRFWAKSKGKVFVYTGVIFKKNNKKTIGKNKVAVPNAFYKIIYAPNTNEAIAFLMPNKNIPNTKSAVIQSRVSINKIESLTGLKFFNNLSAKQKNKVSKMWRTRYN
jgi:endonuclease G, mitochondrial